MKPYDWNEEKNELLKATRGIGFEDVINAISDDGLLTVLQHHNPAKYPNQKVYIIMFNGYAYTVPFVERSNVCFLKTIYPSRKFTKKFLMDNDKEQ